VQPRTAIAPVIAAFLYVFAALLANEWVYLLSIALFLSTALGFILPLLIINALTVKAQLPVNSVAGQDAVVRFLLRRRTGFIHSILPIKLLRVQASLRRRVIASDNQESLLPAEATLIDSLNNELEISYLLKNLARGVYIIEQIELSSSFPFGLVWWTKICPTPAATSSLTVYPALHSISGNFLNELHGMMSSMGTSTSELIVIHQSSSVRGVREFRTGDSMRHIHWPSTARMATLIVREYDCETLPTFDLVFDLKSPWKDGAQFELAVSLVHSLIDLGYSRDMLPQLILNPGEDHSELTPLLYDLPQIPPGPDRYTEILARLDMMPSFSRGYTLSQSLKAQVRSDRALLTVVPAQQSMLVHLPDKGDRLCYPVYLVAAQVGAPTPEPVIFGRDKTKRPPSADVSDPESSVDRLATAAMQKATDDAGEAQLILQNTIATIYSEDDLPHL
jgi:uncharacterized protein (DUF58 family)